VREAGARVGAPTRVLASLLGPFSLLLAVALASPVRAHPRTPIATGVTVDPAVSDRVVVRTTVGLFHTTDGGAHWRFACQDLTRTRALEDPALALGPDSTLVANFAGLVRGDASGCRFDAPEPLLADELVIDVAATAGGRSYALASGGRGLNALFESPDHGRTWTMAMGPLDVLPESVVPAQGGGAYVSATVPPSAERAAGALVIRTFGDGSDPVRHPFELGSEDVLIELLAVDPTDDQHVFARIEGAIHDRLVVSDDAAASWTEAWQADGELVGLVQTSDGQTVWTGGPDMGLLRSDDGGRSFDAVAPELRVSCLGLYEGALFACSADEQSPFHVGVSEDGGEHFEPLFHFARASGPPSCEPAASVCADAWEGDVRVEIETRWIRPDEDGGVSGARADGGPAARSDAGQPGNGGRDAGAPSARDAGPGAPGGEAPAGAHGGCSLLPGRASFRPAPLIGLAVLVGWAARRRRE
jgi:hypothetical protein